MSISKVFTNATGAPVADNTNIMSASGSNSISARNRESRTSPTPKPQLSLLTIAKAMAAIC